MIRVVLPAHLKELARVHGEVLVDVSPPVSTSRVLDAVEAAHPQLLGTIRDRRTLQRRPFIRFYACELDLTFEPVDDPLPDAVVAGTEPLLVVGAMAGG